MNESKRQEAFTTAAAIAPLMNQLVQQVNDAYGTTPAWQESEYNIAKDLRTSFNTLYTILSKTDTQRREEYEQARNERQRIARLKANCSTCSNGFSIRFYNCK